MKKLAARVHARRAKQTQREHVVETTSSAPIAQPETADTTAAGEAELSNEELAEAGSAAGNGAKRITVAYKPDTRSHRDGAAKRPQPQNKPRSQRKK
jgi:preprotein translocase subunit SecF